MLEKVRAIAAEKAVRLGIVSPVVGQVLRAIDPALGRGYLVRVTPLNPCQVNKTESVFVSDQEIESKLHE